MIKWTKEETILIIVEGYCILMYLFWFHVCCFVYYIIFFTSSEARLRWFHGLLSWCLQCKVILMHCKAFLYWIRAISTVWFAVTTFSIQLTSLHHVDAKIGLTLVNRVKEMRLSIHVGPTSCYYKSHRVNWPIWKGFKAIVIFWGFSDSPVFSWCIHFLPKWYRSYDEDSAKVEEIIYFLPSL